VLTPTNDGVRHTTVTLTGGATPLTTTTDTAGNYSFKVLPGTYTLTPTKTFEQNKTNGVSTLDIALIQGHILQRTPFNAAYKTIAGDANNSSGVTTADILFLRRLILGTDTTFSGPSWTGSRPSPTRQLRSPSTRRRRSRTSRPMCRTCSGGSRSVT
jgi:hypothetical protein